MNSIIGPSFKVVFLKKKKKKVLVSPVNSIQDPLKNVGRTKRAWLAAIQTYTKWVFGKKYFCQFILLFSLFLLLFIGSIILFGTIYGFHCTILVNFYLYLQYFQQKVFNFSKISKSQTDLVCIWLCLKSQLILLFSLFLLLFMDSTALFGTIHGSYYTISANFYLYLQYYQQKIFNFSKISGSQTDDKYYFCQLILLFNLFLLLFMGLITLLVTIHRSHYTISANFYLYL